MKTKLTLKLIALFLLPMALAVPGRAAIITWTNVNGGSWSVAANWSPNTVPGAADDVRITSNGTYTVVMNVSPTISSLTLGGISGLQTLTNTGQTLTVSQASLVDTNGILGMNGGTVSGAGTLNVNGLLNWNGGSLGNGGSLTVAANGIMNLQATVSLSGVLTNQGTVNWLGGNVNINTNAPSFTGTIWNQAGALFDVQCDQVMVNGIAFATFHNAGLLRKRVTAGSTFFNVFMDNSGTVQAQTGTIFFSGGANLVGSFQANSGAAINFNGGTYTLSSPPNFQGPGAVQLIAGSSATLNAFTGIFTLNGATLVGQSTIASSGIISLSGSSLGAGATLTVLTNGVLNFPAAVSLSGVLTNQGTINWLGGNVNINTNGPSTTGTIWNQAGALFDIQCDQVVANGIALATFHNAGLLRKRVTAGSTSFNVFMDNSGTVQAQTGTIFFSGGANLVGSFQANSGAAINFNGGTYALSSPPNFQGPGAVQFTGGDITLNAFTGTYTLNGSTLVGQSTIASNGIISLSGSSLGAGATLTVLTNGVLNFPATVSLSGVLTNQGTVNWLGGNVNINTNAPSTTGTIWNQAGALFDIQCDQVVANGIALATFHNAGLLRKRVTAGSTSFNVFMDNSGTVQAQTGTIFFSGGANLGGSFQADTGASIQFNASSYTLGSPPNFQGPGAVQFTGGNITLNAFTGTYTLNGSTLVGQSTIASNGIISLSGSSLGAGATLTVLTNGVLNFPAAVSLSGVLTNQGTVNWLGGNVNINTNAPSFTGTIWNQAGALFDIQCDQVVANGIALATFHNAGLVRKRVTAGTTTFNVFMDNSGTVQAQTGVLTINSYLGSAMSSLAITLASNTPATGFGKIQFATTNSIVGKFILSTLGGYRPTPGTSFFVLGFPAVTGDFTSMEGLDLGNGLRLAPRPFASGMRLVAASYPITALPNLTLDHSLKGLLVGWPTNFTGWMLQTTTNLVAPSWQTIPVAGTNNTIVPIAGIQQYFRLFQ